MVNQKSNELDASTSDNDDKPPDTTQMLGAEEKLEGSTTKYLQDEVANDERTSPPSTVSESQLQVNSESTLAATAPTLNNQ